MLTIRRILHPTDFFESSRAAFDVACALAHDSGAELVVCHVEPLPPVPVVEGVALDLPGDDPGADTGRLDSIRPDDPDIRVVRRLRRGDPVTEILAAADDTAADLIVMGTHGRGGLARLVLGSVAESVMRKAPCPVLTVRAGGRPAPVEAAAAACSR